MTKLLSKLGIFDSVISSWTGTHTFLPARYALFDCMVPLLLRCHNLVSHCGSFPLEGTYRDEQQSMNKHMANASSSYSCMDYRYHMLLMSSTCRQTLTAEMAFFFFKKKIVFLFLFCFFFWVVGNVSLKTISNAITIEALAFKNLQEMNLQQLEMFTLAAVLVILSSDCSLQFIQLALFMHK